MKYPIGTKIKYFYELDGWWIGTVIDILQPTLVYPSGFYTIHWNKRKPGNHSRQFIEQSCQLLEEPNDIIKEIL